MGLKQDLDRELEGIARPDLWAEIESRATRSGPMELTAPDGGRGGLRRQRLVAAVVAFVVFIGALAILWSAFRAASLRPSEPTPSPTDAKPGPRRNGEIIQFEDVAGTPAIDLAAQDPGTGQLRLFGDVSAVIDCYVREPCHTYPGRAAWSADGRWVAFDVYCRRGDSGSCRSSDRQRRGLWVVGAGGEPMQVAGPTGSELVWAWGPAGAEVAYASRYFREGELLVFDPHERTQRSLGRVDGQISAMSWTPDGNRIALAADGALYLVDLGSGEWSRIATYQGAAGEMFSSGWPNGIEWSPDGTRFALVTTTTDRGPTWTYPWDVQVLDAEGSQLFVLPVPGGGRFLGDPPQVGWSPDGTQLVYTIAIHNREKPHGNGGQIWTVASDGSNPTMIFDSGCCLAFSLRPTWSPDGSRFAYQVGRTGGRPIEWFVVDMDNMGEPQPIDESTIRSWGGGSFSSEAWAPGQLGI